MHINVYFLSNPVHMHGVTSLSLSPNNNNNNNNR